MLTGVIHVHSVYSDGEFTLREMREIFRSARCQFVAVTDHADAFDQAKLEAYVHECEALSDGTFLFLPGLEHECDRALHILGYGVTSLLPTRDPQEVISLIKSEGGIAVIAHPQDSAFGWIESFATLPDGIEAWNSKYDGRYAPRPETFKLVQRLQARRPATHAFYGLDLHWKKQFCELYVLVHCEVPARDRILAALAAGDFTARKGDLELPSSGSLPINLANRFARTHRRSAELRRALKGAKRLVDSLGLTVPGFLKARARRML